MVATFTPPIYQYLAKASRHTPDFVTFRHICLADFFSAVVFSPPGDQNEARLGTNRN
jgi:hypothetical protein